MAIWERLILDVTASRCNVDFTFIFGILKAADGGRNRPTIKCLILLNKNAFWAISGDSNESEILHIHDAGFFLESIQNRFWIFCKIIMCEGFCRLTGLKSD